MYVLIMFLVYEKKVLSFADTKDKLLFYLQDKFKARMNEHIKQYKKKLNIKYKPNVYEIQVIKRHFGTIYILAIDEKQATSYAYSKLYNPIKTEVCDINMLMTKRNGRGEKFNITLKVLRDRGKITPPAFLGGI